jgi:hypothetical protein
MNFIFEENSSTQQWYENKVPHKVVHSNIVRDFFKKIVCTYAKIVEKIWNKLVQKHVYNKQNDVYIFVLGLYLLMKPFIPTYEFTKLTLHVPLYLYGSLQNLFLLGSSKKVPNSSWINPQIWIGEIGVMYGNLHSIIVSQNTLENKDHIFFDKLWYCFDFQLFFWLMV